MLTIMRVFDRGFSVFLSSRLVNVHVGASAHWAALRRALVERVTRHARCVGIGQVSVGKKNWESGNRGMPENLIQPCC
jgi:hypothetical protein